MKAKQFFFILVLNISFLCIILSFSFSQKQQKDLLRENTSYKFINPILECDSGLSYKNFRDLRENLEEYITTNIENNTVTDVSYYFQQLKNGENFGHNEEDKFSPASLLKIPLAMSLLDEINIADLSSIEVQNNFSENEFGHRNIGSDELKKGEFYSLEKLLTFMLIDSDNSSAQTILTFIGEAKLSEIYSRLGISNTDIDSQGNVNVKKYSTFFRVLYNASFLSRDKSEYILEKLSHSSFQEGIRKNIPKNIKISNKFGERGFTDSNEKQLHDCGIIYFPNNPYLLCIMTKGTEFPKLEKVIQDISGMVYQDMLKKYQNN